MLRQLVERGVEGGAGARRAGAGRWRRACAGGEERGAGGGALRRGCQYRRECRARRALSPPPPIGCNIT